MLPRTATRARVSAAAAMRLKTPSIPKCGLRLEPMSGPITEPMPLTRMSRLLTTRTLSKGMRSCACANADRVQCRHQTAEQDRDRQDRKQRMWQADCDDSGNRKAQPKPRENNAAVETIRQPADRNLEC